MVWLVQNCRSIKCLQFLKSPELRGGGVSPPWAPYQGSAYDPLGDIKRFPDPSPTHAPLITNPGSAPDYPVRYKRESFFSADNDSLID